jgi:GMP synthase-like glutamine amidotransferase
MRILSVMNNRHVPAGFFGDAILKRGGWYDAMLAPDRTLSSAPTAEAEVPDGPGDYDGLIVLGGLMSADDDAEHPYLPKLAELMRAFDAAGRPVLGICLGAQLLARAWGGRPYRMERIEIGFVPVGVTSAGARDRLLAGLDPRPALMQWHLDSFELPDGAELLMSGDEVTNQGFRIGRCSYGFQFHCEATVDILRQWVMAYAHHADAAPAGFFDDFDAQARAYHQGARRWAEAVADRWVDLVAETQHARRAA